MFYLYKAPWLLRQFFPKAIWHIPTEEKILYCTFDDGPHPEITPFVLDTLKAFDAKATFFCIGKNVEANPGIYQCILEEGHLTGNHTQNHLNGWKTSDSEYITDILEAGKQVNPGLFRPPYGRIRFSQARKLKEAVPGMQLIMWSLLSGDFDPSVSPDKCSSVVRSHAGRGDIVVFHDSEKAFPRLKKALPEMLDYFREKGFRFEAIPVKISQSGR